jgi:hypothetical protein
LRTGREVVGTRLDTTGDGGNTFEITAPEYITKRDTTPPLYITAIPPQLFLQYRLKRYVTLMYKGDDRFEK